MTLPFSNNATSVPFVAQKESEKDAANQILIRNSDFFPDLKLLDLQMRYRVDGSHHPDRQVQALRQAIVDVNAYLTGSHPKNMRNNWVAQQKELGYDNIDDVPGNDLAGMKEKLFLYQTAVFAKAKAILVARWPELFIGRKSRSSKDEPDYNTAEIYEKESKQAIYQIIGKKRLSISLI